MRVVIIGGGFTGLSCAAHLVDYGIETTVFESSSGCGGLAKSFKPANWRWNLEIFYHHFFTSDKDIIAMARKVGAEMTINNLQATSFFNSKEVELDSPLSLIRFSGISFLSRIRMGVGLLLLKLIPNGLFLEKYHAVKILPKLLGPEGYKAVWERLLSAKFGPYLGEVNLAWFWTRIAKRSKKLGYFEGGFAGLTEKMERYIKERGGKILTETEISSVQNRDGGGVTVNGEVFDAVVITTPAPVAKKLFSEVQVPAINYLWGQTLILELSKKMIRGYWMNILEKDFPYLVMVEHTNMIDKKMYGDNRVIYLGNYLPEGHKQLKMTKEQLVSLYAPYLKKINKHFRRKHIKNVFLFREPYSQPVFPLNYSQQISKFRVATGIYTANMSMVYPFDRGTNYAIKLGKEVAKLVISDLR